MSGGGAFTRPYAVGFRDCDPAGIVFYPRFLEMTNFMVETFFAEVLGRPYAQVMADGNGCPTVRLEVEFDAPSRLGEVLVLALRVAGVGRSSADFEISGAAEGEAVPRWSARKRIVWIGEGMRSAPWPEVLRERLEAAMAAHAEEAA